MRIDSAEARSRSSARWTRLTSALVFVAGVLLIGFAAWTLSLVRSVSELRQQVEQRVGWLQDCDRLAAALRADDTAPASDEQLPSEVRALANEIADDDTVGAELRELAASLRAPDAEPTPRQVAALVPALRAETGRLSYQLGAYWDAIYRLAGAAIFLAMSTLASLVYLRYVVLRRAEARLTAMEAHLQDADRLVTIGTLAAGVAHEINNPLGYVMTNLELLREAEIAEADRELVDDVLDGAERVRRIVKDLRQVAHPEPDEVGPCQVTPIVSRALNLARMELRGVATVETDIGEVPPVHGSEDRLVQVFLNLAINAAHAMSSAPAPHHRLVVRAHVDDADPDAQAVCVEFHDSGPGIDPSLRDRVFEPFVTTKAVGKGTGLGLFVCRNIVESIGGHIEIVPVSRGACFRVRLDAASAGDR